MKVTICAFALDGLLFSGGIETADRRWSILTIEDAALRELLIAFSCAAGAVEAEMVRRRTAMEADRSERHAVADREQPPGVVTLGDPSPSPSAGAGLIEEGGAA